MVAVQLELLAKPYLVEGFHLQPSTDLSRRTGCPICFARYSAYRFPCQRLTRHLTMQRP
jgi:hypothetical protein